MLKTDNRNNKRIKSWIYDYYYINCIFTHIILSAAMYLVLWTAPGKKKATNSYTNFQYVEVIPEVFKQDWVHQQVPMRLAATF